MKKILMIAMLYAGGLTASSCTINSSDKNTQFAFALCVAMFMNNPSIAINGIASYQANASTTSQATTACTWCQKMIQGSSGNGGGMTNSFYDPYSSTYGDLTQINYQSLQAILQDAGVFTFIGQGSEQNEAFINCFVNQCGVRQVPNSTRVTQCASGCVALAQEYLTWIGQQALYQTTLTNFETCATQRGCWNNGQYGMGCFKGCLVTEKPYKPTVIPWILSQ